MMTTIPQAFSDQYAAALDEYLSGAGEAALSSAYELGRQALVYDSGILVVTETHHQALQAALLRQTEQANLSDVIQRASDFLTECLSPFEMSQRSFQETLPALRNLTDALRKQQRDLHLLLSPTPNLLLTLDKQDCLAASFVPPNFSPILGNLTVGTPLKDILPAELGTAVLAALTDVRRSAQISRLECPLVHDGRTLYFDFQISPVMDSNDVLLVVDDITARKIIAIAEHEQRMLAEALQDTAVALNSSLNLNDVLDRILVNIGRVVPHDAANIMMTNGNIASVVRSYGYAEAGLEEFEQSISRWVISAEGTPIIYRTIESKKPVIVPDVKLQRSLGFDGSSVSAPILVANAVIGMINLHSFTKGFFTDAHAEHLQIFANQAAVAIQNARLFAEAQEVAAANERQRLARDLHDAVSQTLFSARLISETLPRTWERDPAKVQARLVQLHELIKGAAAEMRVLLWELRPAKLTTAKLDQLLTELVDSVQSRREMTIQCSIETISGLPPDIHVAFYRIAQECINNIVKHSEATDASISLDGDAHQISLRVRDNGRGFSPDDTAAGFGLGSMRERAQLIGATLDINSQPGEGTEITVTWVRTAEKAPLAAD